MPRLPLAVVRHDTFGHSDIKSVTATEFPIHMEHLCELCTDPFKPEGARKANEQPVELGN